MWNIFFKNKENKMSTTDTAAVKRLKTKIESQAKQISALQGRVSELVDSITLLDNEVNSFKQNVASDINELHDRIR